MLEKTVAPLDADTRLGVVYPLEYLFGAQNLVAESSEYDFALLKQKNYIGHCALFRKEAWKKAGGYKKGPSIDDIDWNLWLDIGTLGWLGKLVREPLFFHRV